MSAAVTNITNVNGDLFLEIPRGNVACVDSENKFGRSVNVDTDTDTDIWDGAAPIWLAPTQARVHTISSNHAQDTTGGAGANTVLVSYLPDWDTVEQVEEVAGNLNAGVVMNNAAVIIHRMEVVPQASSTTTNAGTIIATAAVDNTVTAQIGVGKGQTQMAIYGIPSVQVAYMPDFYISALEAAGNLCVPVTLLVNPNPDIQSVCFLTKHTLGATTRGTGYLPHDFKPYKKIDGPAIIKLQAKSSVDNTDVSAGFDVILVDM